MAQDDKAILPTVRRRATCSQCPKSRHTHACDERHAAAKASRAAFRRAQKAAIQAEAALLEARRVARSQLDPTIREWMEDLEAHLAQQAKIVNALRAENVELAAQVEHLENRMGECGHSTRDNRTFFEGGAGSMDAANSGSW